MMKNKYLYIETFGCQMNVHDSEQMAALLADSGYTPCPGVNHFSISQIKIL